MYEGEILYYDFDGEGIDVKVLMFFVVYFILSSYILYFGCILESG